MLKWWRTDTATPLQSGQRSSNGQTAPQTRNSSGLEQFFAYLHQRENLSILDLSGASQANVTFITNLGHRLYSEDALTTMNEVFGSDPETQSNPVRIEMFLKQVLDFNDEQFDGALVWDLLQFLSPEALQATVDRLYRVLKPHSYVLAFFNANEKATKIPAYYYRIAESKSILLSPRGERPATQFFNNRAIEKLFQRYESIKFFLTRDSLREVIAKR